MNTATFFLSTGRCGTQWLAQGLRVAYPDLLRVEHEPLHNDYQPRQMLALRAPQALESREILDHLESVERCLEVRDYVECGHPCWSTLPYLIERFHGRVRIVHLTRHPIPTALSWLTHSAYVPPILPHLSEKILLSPFDEGVAFPWYRDRWSSMEPFEKCLYYWAEVNEFGLRLEGEARVPWLRLSFEKLFASPTMKALLSFLGLPERPAVLESAAGVVDEHHFVAASRWPDLSAATRDSSLNKVAQRLVYDLSAFDSAKLRRRYFGMDDGLAGTSQD